MIDPHTPGFLADPWPHYRELHQSPGPQYSEPAKSWIVFRHADVASVLRDDSIAVAEIAQMVAEIGVRSGRGFTHLVEVLKKVPFFRNAPAHGSLRRLFAAVLVDRPLTAYVPAIEAMVQDLLAPCRRDGGFDAATQFADRLPHLVMAHLLGIPSSRMDALRTFTEEVLQVFNRSCAIREYQGMDRKAEQGVALLQEIVAERRRSPQADGISRMIACEVDHQRLPDVEVARHCYVLFLLGVETTSTLVGSAIRSLLADPERYDELRAQPSLLKAAIEELLRFDSPVQLTVRFATTERVVGGQAICAGDRIVSLLGAANRDPIPYPDPDRLSFHRTGPPHLAFGEARHSCIGATLSRLESHAALTAFLALPPCRLVGDPPRYWHYEAVRRLRHLPLEIAG